MRIRIVAIGRQRAGPLRDIQELYRARLTLPLDIVELEEKRRLPGPELKRREGELLLGALPPAAVVVALDERGRELASADFAARVRRWRDEAADPCFVIGGADGLDAAILDRAAMTLSLGRMTWPHLLARSLLLEQLYRAQQILAGHPYHRE